MASTIAKNQALKAGLKDAHAPESPHLGVAYVREDHPNRPPEVPLQPVEPVPWLLDAFQVVHLVQDVEAGFYRWTVVDEISVDSAPAS
ncbi:hypothetical protein NQK81_12845 [Amycolatopsis roodepoortensis]|uniref:hypothetical protein n=1 Tax=Amycolatopsis roodepoortensis TaxID=700274 RepID=UPI00214B1091|nr:hypothetical protein [Amycolatopsis roodepoortensis]UUV34292.1 hypothetical protein NQK81_12845 [Amycolatopsis roodepoortensis]